MTKRAKEILQDIKDKILDKQDRFAKSVELAKAIITQARENETEYEKKQLKEWSSLLHDPLGKNFLTKLTDQAFRSENPQRAVNQMVYLIKKLGIPSSFSFWQQKQLSFFVRFAPYFPTLSLWFVRKFLYSQTKQVIFPSEKKELKKHIQKRKNQGISLNLNLLGEAILGEEEAEKRVQEYIQMLKDPMIECISVKISSIFSQMNLLSFDKTVEKISYQLKRLYREAKNHPYQKKNGEKVTKFVYLDMEEYADLALTCAAFQKTLEDPEFFTLPAGIALQSYIPDSWLYQQELTNWAKKRVLAGGSPIKIRLVKGANLSMENVISSLFQWPKAPYDSKKEVDANFLRMIEYGCKKENANAVYIGIGSHNLFYVSYALILKEENNLQEKLSIEMLEGMADSFLREISFFTKDILVYCPIISKKNLQNAISYFLRRLEENTAQENFLAHIFDIDPSKSAWDDQVEQFYEAYQFVSKVSSSPKRVQNRLLEPLNPPECCPFSNEPDTDWTTIANQKWIQIILREQEKKKDFHIPLVIGGKEITSQKEKGFDPSCPNESFYTYAIASKEEANLAIKEAKRKSQNWQNLSFSDRSSFLYQVANLYRKNRKSFIGMILSDAGKVIQEADKEVSEAIDFLEYYRKIAMEYQELKDLEFHPKGTILVASPWNFSCAIPTGGIAASLMMGNSVIFKPAPETVAVGYEIVKLFWEAGISKSVLQFLPCQDEPVGSYLIQHPDIDAVVLTGSTETAKKMLSLRENLDLIAETGGKNSMIISNMADLDLSIRDLILSSFGYSGQKCSACSLAILLKEVYEDEKFLSTLKDAARSLKVGSAWEQDTKVSPLINPPNPTLLKGLTELEEGESWLLKPTQDSENPRLWSPGIKLGVKKESFTYRNELFGPVLGIMKADNLEEALKIANGTKYGLTGGIHTLDEREQKKWVQNIHVGNGYINRAITGSIVQRQPFGGIKDSSFGLGFKAGGPQYVLQFSKFIQKENPKNEHSLYDQLSWIIQEVEEKWDPKLIQKWKEGIKSYLFYWHNYFFHPHDPSRILGQDNFLFYVPRKHLILRFQEKDSLFSLYLAIGGAAITGCKLIISGSFSHLPKKRLENPLIVWREETEEEFIQFFHDSNLRRVRFFSSPDPSLLKKILEKNVHYYVLPSLENGRIELLNYLREMSVSIDYHRYGNLGTREKETRAPLPFEEGSFCKCDVKQKTPPFK